MRKNSRHHLVIKRSIDTKENVVRRVTVKTRPGNWEETEQSVIIPLSIYSAIYDGIEGDFKIAALLQTVKTKVKGKITVLLCEGAHLKTLSLKYNNDEEKALQVCYRASDNLFKRYRSDFQGCEVVHWEDFVNHDSFYKSFKDEVYQLYKTNEVFRVKVRFDAQKVSNNEYLDRSLFIERAELDLLEQCVYLMIASKKSYKFEFYTGKRNDCVDFINREFLADSVKLTRVNVTLGTPKCFENIEKKQSLFVNNKEDINNENS